MKFFKFQLVIAALITLTYSNFASAERTASGFDLNKCTKCHNATGGTHDFPRLEGQSIPAFINAMLAYKNGNRHSYWAKGLMAKRVNLDLVTIKELAVYYNQLTPPAGTPGDAALIAEGKEIYQSSCKMCHGKNAEGKGINSRMAGQFKYFIINQMEAYKTGTISGQNDMKDVAASMTNAEVEAVATYLQSL